MADPLDRDLMLAAGAGDAEALGCLFARYHRRLYGFLARLTGDRALADDLVQEVFLRLLRFRGSYVGDGAFVPWLFRVARNAATDHHRRRQAEPPHESPPNSPSALDQLLLDERDSQLARALDQLPVRDREVLLLRGVEGMSYRDIAFALECSEGAARVRVHRAVGALRMHLRVTVED